MMNQTVLIKAIIGQKGRQHDDTQGRLLQPAPGEMLENAIKTWKTRLLSQLFQIINENQEKFRPICFLFWFLQCFTCRTEENSNKKTIEESMFPACFGFALEVSHTGCGCKSRGSMGNRKVTAGNQHVVHVGCLMQRNNPSWTIERF